MINEQMPKTILIASCFALIFILLQSVTATDYCINNRTLISNITVNNELITINESCRYGCDNVTNTCNFSPIIEFGIIFLGLIILIIVLWFLIKKVLRI